MYLHDVSMYTTSGVQLGLLDIASIRDPPPEGAGGGLIQACQWDVAQLKFETDNTSALE